MKCFKIESDYIGGQTKGCALVVHVRYTAFLWFPRWAQEREAALVDLRFFGGRHDPESPSGYRCNRFGVRLGKVKFV